MKCAHAWVFPIQSGLKTALIQQATFLGVQINKRNIYIFCATYKYTFDHFLKDNFWNIP